MFICPYCGSENADENKFCDNCGAPLKERNTDVTVQESSVLNDSSADSYGSAGDDSPNSYDQPYQGGAQNYGSPTYISPGQMVEPIPTGGLVVWAVVVLLLCWIPAAFALYYIFKINKATSYEEQQDLLKKAKTALIIGSVLGVLNLVSQIGLRISNSYINSSYY